MRQIRLFAFACCSALLASCISSAPSPEPGITCLTYISSALTITFRDSATGAKLRVAAFSVVGPGSDTVRLDTSRIGASIYCSPDTTYSVFGGPGAYEVLFPTPSGIRTSTYSVLPLSGESLGCGHAQGRNVEIRLPL